MTTMVSRAILMAHDEDPKKQILSDSDKIIGSISPMGSLVLLGVYVRSGKTKGGVIIPGGSADEDKYQGKIGLVLKWGPLAFVEDENHKWASTPKVHDWVVYRVGDTLPFIMNDRTYRFVEDVDIRAIWTGTPDLLI